MLIKEIIENDKKKGNWILETGRIKRYISELYTWIVCIYVFLLTGEILLIHCFFFFNMPVIQVFEGVIRPFKCGCFFIYLSYCIPYILFPFLWFFFLFLFIGNPCLLYFCVVHVFIFHLLHRFIILCTIPSILSSFFSIFYNCYVFFQHPIFFFLFVFSYPVFTWSVFLRYPIFIIPFSFTIPFIFSSYQFNTQFFYAIDRLIEFFL